MYAQDINEFEGKKIKLTEGIFLWIEHALFLDFIVCTNQNYKPFNNLKKSEIHYVSLANQPWYS